jgi:beta-galactosidase
MAGVAPQVKIDDNAVQARFHQGAGGSYLWVLNQTRSEKSVKVTLASGLGNFASGEDIWSKRSVVISNQLVTVTVPGRDAAVIALR